MIICLWLAIFSVNLFFHSYNCNYSVLNSTWQFNNSSPSEYSKIEHFILSLASSTASSYSNGLHSFHPASSSLPGVPQLAPVPHIPPAFILVGCACDLRHDIQPQLYLAERNERPVDQHVAEGIARELGAQAYIECSALTQKQLKIVFDLAIWHGLRVAESVAAVNRPGSLLSPLPLGPHPRRAHSFEARADQRVHSHSKVHSSSVRRRSLDNAQRSVWKRLLCPFSQ